MFVNFMPLLFVGMETVFLIIHAQETKNVCDKFYTPGVDFVYVPSDRLNGNIHNLLDSLNRVTLLIENAIEGCIPALQVFCHVSLPPCGDLSIFEPPTSVCEEVCRYIVRLCPEQWQEMMDLIEVSRRTGSGTGLSLINCSNTGEHLEPLPHCCSYAGVEIRMSVL